MARASDEEMNWLREMVSDEDFIKRLSVYGNFMHGTHVARIAARKTLESKILAVKLIPTEVKLPVDEDDKKRSLTSGLKDRLIKFSLRKLAEQQMKLLKEISEYVINHGADVANGSFGTGFAQAKMLIKTVADALKIDLTSDEVEKYSNPSFLNWFRMVMRWYLFLLIHFSYLQQEMMVPIMIFTQQVQQTLEQKMF